MNAMLRCSPILALCAICPAQESVDVPPLPRGTVTGIVRDAAGEPVPGAEVRLLSRPIGDLPTVGDADELDARADEEGRFRAGLLVGRTYTAWAFSDGEEGESVSEARERVAPGTAVDLDLSRPREAVRVPVDGAEHFDGPLMWQLVVETENAILARGALDPTGIATLPPVPHARAELAILDAGGRPLHIESLGATRWRATIGLTDPLPRTGSVESFANDEPIAGASVLVSCAGVAVPVGSTDADGEARLPAAPKGAAFAAAPGHGLGCLRGDGHAHVALGEGLAIRGRVLIAPDSPAAGTELITRESATHLAAKNNFQSTHAVRAVRTDAEGRFHLASLSPRPMQPSVNVVLGAEVLAQLPAAWSSAGLVPVVFDAFDCRGEDEVDVGPLLLSDCVPVRLRVSAQGGVAASGATVEFVAAPPPPFQGARQVGRVVSGQDGAVALLLPPGRTLTISIRHASSAQVLSIDTTAGEALAEPIEVPITLPPPEVVRGRAVDPNGHAVAGAKIEMGVSPLRRPEVGSPTPTARLLDHPRVTVAVSDQPARFLLTAMEMRAPQHAITGEDGRFEFAVPPGAGALLVHVVEGGRGHVRLDAPPDREFEIEVQPR